MTLCIAKLADHPVDVAGVNLVETSAVGAVHAFYSTVTVFARFRGWSTLRPRSRAIR